MNFGIFQKILYKFILSASRPTPKLEDQASVFIPPGDRVAQLYLWAQGSSVYRLTWASEGCSGFTILIQNHALYKPFTPENGGSTFFRNISIFLGDHKSIKPRISNIDMFTAVVISNLNMHICCILC
jgi:hypothetical protein